MSSPLVLRHRELIAKVNDAKTDTEHRAAREFLAGWRDGIAAGVGESNWMDVIDWTDADQHHGDTDRPTCLGVFLDWQPEPTS